MIETSQIKGVLPAEYQPKSPRLRLETAFSSVFCGSESVVTSNRGLAEVWAFAGRSW